MKNQHETSNDTTQSDSTAGGLGDVEAAGETTAAAAITGPTDTRPVGADTMVKVSDSPKSTKRAETESE